MLSIALRRIDDDSAWIQSELTKRLVRWAHGHVQDGGLVGAERDRHRRGPVRFEPEELREGRVGGAPATPGKDSAARPQPHAIEVVGAP